MESANARAKHVVYYSLIRYKHTLIGLLKSLD